MILFTVLISWASAASVHGFQVARSLVRVTLHRHFLKNSFSFGSLASAHHNHYRKMHTWQDQDASSPNREAFVRRRELTGSIIFQTPSPQPLRGWLGLMHAGGQTPALSCALTNLVQRMQTDNPQPLLNPRCVVLGSCIVFQKMGCTDHISIRRFYRKISQLATPSESYSCWSGMDQLEAPSPVGADTLLFTRGSRNPRCQLHSLAPADSNLEPLGQSS